MVRRKRQRTLFGTLARLDWSKILRNAIENRRSSWGNDVVREWRNASDEIFGALMQALREKEIDPYEMFLIKKERRANAI